MKKQLDKNEDFIVKESVILNFIIAAVFLAIFISALVSYFSEDEGYNKSAVLITGLFVLIPAAFFVIKGLSKKACITVNTNGIYHYKIHITNWENFISAKVEQDNVPRSLKDNFVLAVKYYKTGIEGSFQRRLPLTFTQNKSEEEVAAAVKFYYAAFQH